MKYQGKHSAFPFKESPIKLDEGTDYTPYTPPPTTTPTTTGGGEFTSQYDLIENPYGKGAKARPQVGMPGWEWKMGKEAWEKGGGATGVAIRDLDRRVSNLGG